MLSAPQIEHYLRFLGLSERPPATRAALADLQRRHMERVAFENFNVYVRRPLSLQLNDLFHKVVGTGRGGYCFELNTLYQTLLTGLGFILRPSLARVLLRNPETIPTRNHLTAIVTLPEGEFLSDVGFGGLSTRVPLSIKDDTIQSDGEGHLRITQSSPVQYLLERQTVDDWQPQYSFEDVPVYPSDVHCANFFVEHHPTSHFTYGRYIGRFTDDGRIGLFENQFTRRVGQETVEQLEIPNGPGWLQFVVDRFGITPDFEEEETNILAYGRNSR